MSVKVCIFKVIKDFQAMTHLNNDSIVYCCKNVSAVLAILDIR